MKRKIITIATVSILVMVLITGAVYALTGATFLTSTGSIAVAANEEYSLSGTVLAFGDTPSVNPDESITRVATITITNDGLTDITGIGLVVTQYPAVGTGWDLVVESDDAEIVFTETATLTFTLTGTAPSAPATIDLTQILCSITPTG